MIIKAYQIQLSDTLPVIRFTRRLLKKYNTAIVSGMAMAKTGALFPPWKAAVARTIRDIEVPRMKARL